MPLSPLIQSCLPLILAIAAFGLLAAVLVRMTFVRGVNPQRMTVASLHRDERGGVQSLAFVLTFPLLILIVLFIVQLSQLLIGVVTVHYAAFAAARAASVWIPAVTNDGVSTPAARSTNANILPGVMTAGVDFTIDGQMVDAAGSRKLREIWSAAALGCVSISPSRATSSQATSSLASSAAGSLTAVARAIDSSAAANGQMPARMANKANYSFSNTSVVLHFDDRSSTPSAAGEIATYNPVGHPTATHVSSEVGWQDPVRITVKHKFALLPGPARWLVKGIANSDGRIVMDNGVYKTTLSATATMTVEGLQSLRPRTYAP